MRDDRPADTRFRTAAPTRLAITASLVTVVVATAGLVLVPPAAGDARLKDRDGDGLSNRFELRRSKTNPRKRDTDGDRLGDRYELRKSKTNPRKKDTDGDGLSDRYELRKSKTNPRKKNPTSARWGPPADWPFPPVKTWRCNRSATNSSQLGAQWSAARPGETICLTSGDFGSFRAGGKPGLVAIRPHAGAVPSMSLDFSGAVNVLVEGITIAGGSIGGASRNVAIAQSRFTDLLKIDTSEPNANILLDRNTHRDIDTCGSDCIPARVTVLSEATPSGVTIKNSLFAGGNSDGVRPDGADVQVVNNEFRAFQERDSVHTDPIQIYGGTRVTIRGNYFNNAGGEISAYIMMADGGEGNVVENNVFAPGGHGYALTWYSDNGSIIQHNTFAHGSCTFNIRCGIINLGNKSSDEPGRGTVIRNNVIGSIGFEEQGTSSFTSDHNLIRDGGGAGNLSGTPSFVGGANPTSYSGFRLARRSRGRAAASDGTDIGIR